MCAYIYMGALSPAALPSVLPPMSFSTESLTPESLYRG